MAVKRSAKKIATTALKRGRDEANRILDLREAAHERRKVALEKLKKNDETLALRVHMTAVGAAESVSTLETAGFLAAAGDSWFDYPFHDVLKMLDDDFGYNVESSAHKGDPIERMAYQGGQLEDFARKLEKIQAQGATPKAVCFPVAVTIWRATSSACCSTTSTHLSAAGTKKCCRVCSRTEFQPLTHKCSAASQSFARGCFRRRYRFWCTGTIIRCRTGGDFSEAGRFPVRGWSRDSARRTSKIWIEQVSRTGACVLHRPARDALQQARQLQALVGQRTASHRGRI